MNPERCDAAENFARFPSEDRTGKKQVCGPWTGIQISNAVSVAGAQAFHAPQLCRGKRQTQNGSMNYIRLCTHIADIAGLFSFLPDLAVLFLSLSIFPTTSASVPLTPSNRVLDEPALENYSQADFLIIDI